MDSKRIATPGIVVREGGEADEAMALAVSRAAFDTLRDVYRPTPKALERQAARTAHWKRVVAVADGRVAGTALFGVRGRRLVVFGLAVDPGRRGRGVGRAILAWLADRAATRRLRAVALNTIRESGNVPYFEKRGFRVLREVQADWCVSDVHPRLHDVAMEAETPR